MAARTPIMRSLLRLRTSRATLQPAICHQTTRALAPAFLHAPAPSSAPRAARTFATTTPHFSTQPPIDPLKNQAIESAIEQITELYGTARDEFEMAAEETEKDTIYAADDREAAREALGQLLRFFNSVVVEGKDQVVADEVKRRVGQRIRELENAVIGLEESVVEKGS